MNPIVKREYISLIIKSIAGGLAISLGTLASKLCPYEALAPLLFAVGIFLVIDLDLCLITRHIPTFGKNRAYASTIILVVNLLTAYLFGLMFDFQVKVPDNLFLMSIGGGALIGLVSLVNIYGSKLSVLIMTMLMYVFVMLGMPHCVVYAFLNVDVPTLLIVIAGNIIGGLLVGLLVHRTQYKKFLK